MIITECRATERVTESRELALLLFPRSLLDGALQDAICGYRDGEPTPMSREAMEWLTDRSSEPASFACCCSWLGLDAEEYRHQVLATVWEARLRMQKNPTAVRSRFKAYSLRQCRQVRKELAAW